MTVQPPANLYTQGFGSRPESVEVPVVTNVNPSSQQINFPIGKRWINTLTNSEYVLTSETTVAGVTTATWTLLESGSSSFLSLTGGSGGAITPVAGNITLAGTANQITTTGSAGTITFALAGPYAPATYTAHGVLIGEGTGPIVATAAGATGQTLMGATGADPAFTSSPSFAGSVTAATGLIATAGGIAATGTSTINTTGAAVTSIGTGGTGAVNIGNATGNTAVTGSLTASTSLTATLGAITATNGNLVFGTAGNKIISTSVGTTTAAGANSFGSVTLVTGTATVATTAVTASSLIVLWRQSIGATGANPLGELTVGTITAGTSFVITAATTASATTPVATDVSVVGWMIIN